jgi:probable HAF family extracellular repeat protein
MHARRLTAVLAVTAILIGYRQVATTATLNQQYSVEVVGDFGPGWNAFANGMNAAGDVVGQVVSSSDPAFSRPWRQLHGQSVPEMFGDHWGAAEAINDDGTIVGSQRLEDGRAIAFRYTDASGFVDVGSLGGRNSFGAGINRHGDVSGTSTLADNSTIRAFRTVGLTVENLGTLTHGGGTLFGYAINDAGQVTGLTLGSTSHAFRFTSGIGLQDLGTLGGEKSQGYGINQSGQVAGQAFTGYDSSSRGHAFRYTDGIGMEDLMPGPLYGGAYALNDAGDVVGSFVTVTSGIRNGPDHAFLFTDAQGLRDLNDYVDLSTGWLLEIAKSINNAGQIAGFGQLNGVRRSFRLTKDTEAPTILNASSSVAVLWPPDGHMVPVQLTVDARDNLDPAPVCGLAEIVSSEPDGTVQFEITGPISATLKADRDGKGPGRRYDMTVACRDRSGNTAQRHVQVLVPHDQVGR